MSETVYILRFYAGLTPVVCLRQMVAHYSARKKTWLGSTEQHARGNREGGKVVHFRPLNAFSPCSERKGNGRREGGRVAFLLSKAEPYTESKLTHTGRESPLKREEKEEGPTLPRKPGNAMPLADILKSLPLQFEGKHIW